MRSAIVPTPHHLPLSRLALGGLTLFAALCFSACATGPEKKEGKAPEAQLLGLEIDGDAETELYDLNGDGQTDVWKIFVRRGNEAAPREQRPRLLARHDLDLNFDKTIDVRRHFNAEGAVVREEMDLDFDGAFDAIDYFSDGALYRRDLALNFAGRPSIRKFYTGDQLARKERDTNDDGTMDTIEYYEGGKLVRVGEDRDGDGKPDLYREPADPSGT